MDKQREQFEGWLISHFGSDDADTSKDDCGVYESLLTGNAWMVWQAAQKAAVPDGWKAVPLDPTIEMWRAVNRLDDEMCAGGYDGHGATIEQCWNCMVDTALKP